MNGFIQYTDLFNTQRKKQPVFYSEFTNVVYFSQMSF